MSLLGVEISDTHVTAAAFDIEGRVIGRGEANSTVDRADSQRAEVSMERVWDALVEAVSRATCELTDQVTAMSLAVQGEASVPVDRNGNSLGPSTLSEDTRSADVARDFQERVSPIEVMRVTGMPMGRSFGLLRLLWLREHEPEVYRNTWKFLDWQAYVVSRLGLEPTTDPSLAGRTQMFDVISHVWADGIIDAAGLDRGKVSEVKPTGTLLGEISRKAADALGLPAGTKFVLGGYDRAVAALGVGAAASGHALNATEGGEVLVPAFHEPVVDVDMMKNGFSCGPHVVPEMYVSVAHNPTGGALLDWYREITGPGVEETDEHRGFDALIEEMDGTPTDLMVLPYFGPSGTPYHDPKPIGTVTGLTLSTRRGTLVRGLLEGLAFEMKLNTTLLAESGIRLSEVHVSGAPARSRGWCQLKADVLGVPVCRHVGIGPGVLGAAMLAGVGSGVYDSVSTAVEFCVTAEEQIRPSGERSDLYERKFLTYRRLYPALREIIH